MSKLETPSVWWGGENETRAFVSVRAAGDTLRMGGGENNDQAPRRRRGAGDTLRLLGGENNMRSLPSATSVGDTLRLLGGENQKARHAIEPWAGDTPVRVVRS